MQTIMIGTSNQSKVSFFAQLLEEYDVQVIGTEELDIEPPEEYGHDPIENATLKAEYYSPYAPVVIGADSGLYFNEIPLDDPRQPGLHVRRPEGVYLDDEDMIAYYSKKIHDLGGTVTAYYLDGTVIKTQNGCYPFLPTLEELLETAFTMTDTPVAARKKGWPLDSLCYDPEGIPFLAPGRTKNAQLKWAYGPRLRSYIVDLLNLHKKGESHE